MGRKYPTYIGSTAEQALEDFYPYSPGYLSPDANAGRGFCVDRTRMIGLAVRHGAMMVGDPREAAEKILGLHSELGVARFLSQVQLDGIPQQMARGSIGRFGERVALATHYMTSN